MNSSGTLKRYAEFHTRNEIFKSKGLFTPSESRNEITQN